MHPEVKEELRVRFKYTVLQIVAFTGVKKRVVSSMCPGPLSMNGYPDSINKEKLASTGKSR